MGGGGGAAGGGDVPVHQVIDLGLQGRGVLGHHVHPHPHVVQALRSQQVLSKDREIKKSRDREGKGRGKKKG